MGRRFHSSNFTIKYKEDTYLKLLIGVLPFLEHIYIYETPIVQPYIRIYYNTNKSKHNIISTMKIWTFTIFFPDSFELGITNIRVSYSLQIGPSGWTSRHQLCKVSFHLQSALQNETSCLLMVCLLWFVCHPPYFLPIRQFSPELLNRKTHCVRVASPHVQPRTQIITGGTLVNKSLKGASQKPDIRYCLCAINSSCLCARFKIQSYISKTGLKEKA